MDGMLPAKATIHRLVAVEASEDHLAWEARQRRPAAIAAAAAALLVFVGTVWRGLALSDLPRNGLIESLGRAAEPGAIGGLESLKADTYRVFEDQAIGVIASSVLVAIGYVALGWALTYLAVAARARRPEMPKLLVYLPMIAGILQALATLLSSIGLNLAIGDFLSGDPTVDAARDVPRSGIGVFGQLIGLPGGLGLALAIVLISLNAMRVGLLTRFMGVLGIITGALQILPFAGPLPVVQSFWLLMLALLFSGRWRGMPPAWSTGNAEPWPSAAEVREQRRKAAAEARGETYEPPRPPAAEPEPEPVPAGRPSPSASARKRKRKRR
jgi:hypothetical protein